MPTFNQSAKELQSTSTDWLKAEMEVFEYIVIGRSNREHFVFFKTFFNMHPFDKPIRDKSILPFGDKKKPKQSVNGSSVCSMKTSRCK